jgi:hypothetical protein
MAANDTKRANLGFDAYLPASNRLIPRPVSTRALTPSLWGTTSVFIGDGALYPSGTDLVQGCKFLA